MDEDGIGLVLARATELRLKIGNCIHKASAKLEKEDDDDDDDEGGMNGGKVPAKVEDEGMEEDEEAERLLSICDALEALETQLGNLQALQQQHQYEREATLADIENSRRKLLDKLNECKEKDLEVIQETCAFAGETVEHNGDLLLPPYPSCPPQPLFLNNGHSPRLALMHKSLQNGNISAIANDSEKNFVEPKKNQMKNGSKDSRKGLGRFVAATAKAVITLVGVVSLLNFTGFGPKFAKRGNAFNILGMFQQTDANGKQAKVQCPPGKVLLMENGEARRVARERVEVPFEPVVSTPDVNYGCG